MTMQWPMMVLFASLPFFAIRSLTGGYSLTLFVLVSILALNAKKVKTLNRLESGHALFLGFALVSVLLTTSEAGLSAWLKSLVYFTTFIGLCRYIEAVGLKAAANAAIVGTRAGIALYLLLAIVALAYSGQLRGIFSNIGYYTFTFKIQKSIADLTGFGESFASLNVMRNTMGEIFALTCLLPIVFATHRKLNHTDYITISLGFLMVLASFSRRALIMVAIVTLLSSGALNWKLRTIIFLGFASILYLIFVKIGMEHRFNALEEPSRLYQFKLAITEFIRNPIAGAGYGAQLPVKPFGEPAYVHNFVLANSYMLGVIGLAFSLFVIGQIALRIFNVKRAPHMALLTIPLLGMMVGGTVQGMYTPVAWLVFAFCFAISMKPPSPPTASFSTKRKLPQVESNSQQKSCDIVLA